MPRVHPCVAVTPLRVQHPPLIGALGGIIKEAEGRKLSNVVNAISKNRGRLTAAFNGLCK